MRRIAAWSFALSVMLPLSASAQQKDWPQWRGPNRDGIGKEKGLLKEWPTEGPPLVWDSLKVNKEKSIGTGWSSMSIVGGRLFTMGDFKKDCHVVALDVKTGKVLWSTKIGTTRSGDGPRCTPTVDGDRVYGLTNAGQLACLKVEDGSILWSKDYVKDFKGHYMAGWHFCESPLVDGDKLLCTPGADDAGMVALDKTTGDVLWKCPMPGSGGCGYSSIVVSNAGGVRQYITLMGSGLGLVGVDAKAGKLLWNYKRIANGTANIPTALVKDDLVFTSTGYGTGAALLQLVPDKGGIKVVEKYFLKGGTLQNHHGQMIWLGDYIYGGHGHNDGRPFCLHVASGKLAWGPESAPGARSAAVVYADGELYFRYEDNILALIDATPEGYNLKSTFELPVRNTGWPHPVIADGKLYVRGQDQVVCYDVRK